MSKDHASFSPTILDHFLHPRNAGIVEDPTVRVELVNDICGDRMSLTLSVHEGVINDAKFRSFGCAVAIATASLLTEAIKGRRLADAGIQADQVFVKVAGETYGEKEHCRTLVERAWRQAVEQIEKMN